MSAKVRMFIREGSVAVLVVESWGCTGMGRRGKITGMWWDGNTL